VSWLDKVINRYFTAKRERERESRGLCFQFYEAKMAAGCPSYSPPTYAALAFCAHACLEKMRSWTNNNAAAVLGDHQQLANQKGNMKFLSFPSSHEPVMLLYSKLTRTLL